MGSDNDPWRILSMNHYTLDKIPDIFWMKLWQGSEFSKPDFGL